VRIDLHTHSTASDGTFAPAEIVGAAAACGLDVVALTDHDTTAGWAEAAAALPPGLTLVPGAELSCRWYGTEEPDGVWAGTDRPHRRRSSRTRVPIALHLLAYLFDPAHPELAAALAGVRDSRESRARRMVDLLRADGIAVKWDEIHAAAGGGSIGRPHLAQALVRLGLVPTVSAAFASEWLGQRYRVPKADLDVFETLALVRAAGGVTVFAHPRATVRGRVVPDRLIAELAAAGLTGLEADHEDHSPTEREHVRGLARELGLLVTGSSDFHGANKTVRLGSRTTAPDQFERLVAAATFGRPVTLV
jgi:3',5'-nucleoside bisphosphate phosphatase